MTGKRLSANARRPACAQDVRAQLRPHCCDCRSWGSQGVSEGGVVIDKNLFQSGDEAWNGGRTGIGARKEGIGELTHGKGRVLVCWNEVEGSPCDLGFLCT